MVKREGTEAREVDDVGVCEGEIGRDEGTDEEKEKEVEEEVFGAWRREA